MSTINNGGPAFPVEFKYGDGTAERAFGMTLRDYFAAKALAAMIGRDGKDYATRGKAGVPILARYAYEYADAMLKAREGGAA